MSDFVSDRMEAIRDAIISADEEQFSILMKDPLHKEQLSECVLRNHGPNLEFPLYWAAQDGSLYILVYILQAGGNVRQRTAKGWTALHAAASKNRLEIVEELLKVPHADVDALTYNKDTALILDIEFPDGSEVCIGYGPRTLADLLVWNGFVPVREGDEEDGAKIRIGVPAAKRKESAAVGIPV